MLNKNQLSKEKLLESIKNEQEENFTVDVSNLSRYCGLPVRTTAFYSQAAEVMLELKHPGKVKIKSTYFLKELDGSEVKTEYIDVMWNTPSENDKNAQGNHKDATEDGACAIAIAVASKQGFKVIARSFQKSGCDFLMRRINESDPDAVLKLEVSGIAEDGAPSVRLKSKVNQGKGGELDKPGMAMVVQFKEPEIHAEGWK